MKTKKIIILLAFMIIGMVGYSQYPVTVKNLIDTKYDIEAVYVDNNNNYISFNYLLDEVNQPNNPVTLPFTQTGYPDYKLDHWQIYAHDCSPAICADHEYGTADTDQITHCNQCSNGAVSNYYINSYGHFDTVGCRP